MDLSQWIMDCNGFRPVHDVNELSLLITECFIRKAIEFQLHDTITMHFY